MSLIKVDKLSFGYSSCEILEELSFELDSGNFLAIAGPNGAGKSTLLNLLSGALKPKSGSISIEDKAIGRYTNRQLCEKIAVVRQEFVPIYGFSVIETVLMARTAYYSRTGFERKIDREIAIEALEATDTLDFAERRLGQLSSGERQRVFIARALAQKTDILLLDEPTSFLDLRHQIEIYDLLKKMQLEKNKAILMVTHNINLASQYADVALILGADSSYNWGSTKEIFTSEQIEKVFGVKTVKCIIEEENFFLPLGKFAKINQKNKSNPNR